MPFRESPGFSNGVRSCRSFLITPSTSIFSKLPAPSTQASATAAVAAAIKHLHPVCQLYDTCDEMDP